jgi:hypothetical protein
MAAVELGVDISALIDAVLSGDNVGMISRTRSLLEQERNADVLLGRIGLLASKGDPEGHVTVTLAAAAMLARFLRARPAPLDTEVPAQIRALPLFIRALVTAGPAIRNGKDKTIALPQAIFPSAFLDQDKGINQTLNEAIHKNDTELVERILLGLYGTGADYRTLQIRAYEAISTTFSNGGHPLQDAVRGFQLLDAVEWGKEVSTILHWLAPQLPINPSKPEPAWIQTVRDYVAEPKHSVASIRTRLSAPKNANALALREVILSNADTATICEQVYTTLIAQEATPLAVASVVALAATQIAQSVGDEDRDLFIRTAHGLLFASATHNVFRQVQDEEAYNLVFTAAAYINVLFKEIAALGKTPAQPGEVPSTKVDGGGGFIAVSQLEALEKELTNKDLHAATNTAQRYLLLGHDPRALFGTIGLVAAQNDTTIDQGHSLQIVQAAGEEYTTWPRDLKSTNVNVYLQVALRAAAFGKRDALVSHL